MSGWRKRRRKTRAERKGTRRKKGGKPHTTFAWLIVPLDRFARMSVYKRGAHINLLYLSPFPSMRIKGTKVSFGRQRKRELTVDVDTVTNTSVAIRYFSRIQTMVVARQGKSKQNTKERNAREAAAPGYASSWRGIQGYR